MAQQEIRFTCLYTTQKTQKRKKWKDGEIRINPSSRVVCIFPTNEKSGRVELDSVDEKYFETAELTPLLKQIEDTFETEKFLVTVEFDHRSDSDGGASTVSVKPILKTKLLQPTKGPVMKKFKKPGAVEPRPIFDQQSKSNTSQVPICSMYDVSSTSPNLHGMNSMEAEPAPVKKVANWFSDCPKDETYLQNEQEFDGSLHNSRSYHFNECCGSNNLYSNAIETEQSFQEHNQQQYHQNPFHEHQDQAINENIQSYEENEHFSYRDESGGNHSKEFDMFNKIGDRCQFERRSFSSFPFSASYNNCISEGTNRDISSDGDQHRWLCGCGVWATHCDTACSICGSNREDSPQGGDVETNTNRSNVPVLLSAQSPSLSTNWSMTQSGDDLLDDLFDGDDAPLTTAPGKDTKQSSVLPIESSTSTTSSISSKEVSPQRDSPRKVQSGPCFHLAGDCDSSSSDSENDR